VKCYPNSVFVLVAMDEVLVGYARNSHRQTLYRKIKLSINVDAFKDCDVYTTSDGQQYVALEIDWNRLQKVVQGERVVTTVTHIAGD